MAITAISRDQGINVSIVRVTSSDTLAELSAVGYVTTQIDAIKALNSGTWEWQASDAIMAYCSDGHGIFEFSDEDFATFVPVAGTEPNMISGTTDAFAGGSAAHTFTVTGLTVNCKGSAVIRASTNSVSITKALPGTDQLAVTFSADPGANTTVDYIYTTTSQP
jgi:hypothetical protein